MKKLFNFFSDWKHWIMVVLTSLSIFVPLVIWQVDNQGRSLSLTISDRIQLQILEKESIPEMEVIFNGERISKPYLSELRISNDSRKPIPASDFESPIEIRTASSTKIHSARLKSSESNEIDAKVVFDSSSVRVNPILLNPGEGFSISIVTSGGMPEFSTRARIAGVSVPPLQQAASTKKSNLLTWIYLIAAFSLAIVSSLAQDVFQPNFISQSKKKTLRARSLLFIALVTQLVAIGFLIPFFTGIGVDSLWITIFLVLGIFWLASPLAKFLNRPAPDKPADLFKEERLIQRTDSMPNSLPRDNFCHENTCPRPSAEILGYLSSPGEVKKYIMAEESRVPLLELNTGQIFSMFYGAEVDWELLVDRIDVVDQDRVQIEASRPGEIVWANSGDIALSDNPDVKSLIKGSNIRMVGRIARIKSKELIILESTTVYII